jgi:ABC-type branched-subunit amino acid transport system permease subunit
MVPFLVSGGLFGALVGVMLTVLGPSSRDATSGQVLILLGGSGLLLGGLVGAIVYLLVERLSPR